MVEFVGEPLLSLRSEEVGPTDVTNEQEVAAEQHPGRLVAPHLVEQRTADMLWGVARCVQSLQAQAAEADLLSIFNDRVGIWRRPLGAAKARAVNARLVR